MKNNQLMSLLLLLVMLVSCDKKNQTEIYQTKRDNIVDVHDLIKEIKITDVFLQNRSVPYIFDKYLFLVDYKSINKIIHVLNKFDFTYTASIASMGHGPREISRAGNITYDEVNNKLLISDHGKQKIISFDLDSAILNLDYLPIEKIKMTDTQFMDKYIYVNDTLSYGVCITPIGTNNFKPTMGKWNMKTGEIKKMKYENPKIKKKRIFSAVSLKYDSYVECHAPYDLMTICSLDGNLKFNIYGPDWDDDITDKSYYSVVTFCDNKIIALYSGEKRFLNDGRLAPKSRFLVFDINGNYLKTLETGFNISEICFDEENNRLILSMDEEMQFGYLDLKGII